MNTPRYVIRKIGDQYIPVLQPAYPRMQGCVGLVLGALLIAVGANQNRFARALLFLLGIGVATHGVLGPTVWQEMLSRLRIGIEREKPAGSGPSFPRTRRSANMQQPIDLLDEQLMESFPASDAPSSSTPALSTT